MLVTVMILALAQTPDARALEPSEREAGERAVQPEPEWLPNDLAVAEVKASDDARVKRFVGALVGGVVGAAAPTAFLPLTAPGLFPSLTVIQAVLGLLAPLTTITGAILGYELMGGEGGSLAPALALVPAGLVAAALLFTVPDRSNSLIAVLPAMVTGLLVLAAGSALALDLRRQQLDELGAARARGAATGGRVLAVSFANVFSLAAGAASVGLTLAFGQGTTTAGVFAVLLAAGSLAGTAALDWGVHRGLRGKGSYASALVGLLAGGGGGALVTLLAAASSTGTLALGFKGSVAAVLALGLPVLAGALIAPIALEWSHTSRVGEEAATTLSVGGAPMPGGGMLTAAVRF